MEIFKVDRSKLRVPETRRVRNASMLDGCGMSCILGLYGLFNQIPESDLKGLSTPRQAFCQSSNDVTRRVYGKFVDAGFPNAPAAWNLMTINDTVVGDEAYLANGVSFVLENHSHREELWAKEFAKLGIQVEFFGELTLAMGGPVASN